jgi:RNA polymerase sigma-70 factor, ECF subfamily
MQLTGCVRLEASYRCGLVTQPASASSRFPAITEPPELRALFESYYSRVWRLLRRLGVPEAQVDDATQEVFWVTARRLSDIVAGREYAFIYGVALRVASTELRKQKSALPLTELELVPQLIDEGPSPERQLEHSRARALLDEVLLGLPLELRTVLVLFELEGLEVQQIAELEGIPTGTASSRLRRAREEFSSLACRARARLAARPGVRR